MNVANYIILFLAISYTLVSCETKQSGDIIGKEANTYLTINLENNIRSLIPASNGNRSEKFLYNQLYEPLLSKNESGKPVFIMIQDVSLDSASNTYTFSLLKNRKFSDGKALSTVHIKNWLFRLFSNNSKNAEIQSFVDNILGYTDYSTRKSGIKQDDLPSGVKIIDDAKFSLTIINDNYPLLDKLSRESFYIYRITESEKILGTGPFEIDYSNGDIIYELRRNFFYEISKEKKSFSGLNIRFIKNKNALIDEFLNESIDIIHYSSFNERSNELDSFNSKNHRLKNIAAQDSTTLQYLTFHNFNNLSTLDYILNQVHLDSSLIIKINNEKFRINKDTLTSSYRIPVINNTNRDYSEWLNLSNSKFAGKLNLSLKQKQGINLNYEYIVINECRIKMKVEKPNKNIIRLLFKNSEENISALAVLNYQHDLIIFSQNITGFKNYGNWVDDIKGLTYSQPLAY